MTYLDVFNDENLNLNVAQDLKILQHVLKDKDAREVFFFFLTKKMLEKLNIKYISVRECGINMVNKVQLHNIRSRGKN